LFQHALVRVAAVIGCLLALGGGAASRAQAGPAEFADLSGTIRHPLEAGTNAGSVLIFYWHDCPICNSYAPEINRLSAAYANFAFYIVQVDPDLTPNAARVHARQFELRPPVFLDRRHLLVRLAKASVAPEAVVFGKDGNVQYRGRINNLYRGRDKCALELDSALRWSKVML
jgi:thiol-disulfide isomerase/thioredoxin